MNTNFKLSFLLILAIFLVHYAQSLDIESAKERSCVKISKTVSVDMDWMMSVKKWYHVQMSRFDLYKTAMAVTKKNGKELNEDEVYYKGCINWSMNPNDLSYVVNGFGGHQVTYKVKPLDANFESSEVISEDGESGISYNTLTDNKTFIFAVVCFKDSNQMAWGVGSPYKSLPKKTIKLIHDHAESLGFKREYFTSFRYDSCDKDEGEQGKNEL